MHFWGAPSYAAETPRTGCGQKILRHIPGPPLAPGVGFDAPSQPLDVPPGSPRRDAYEWSVGAGNSRHRCRIWLARGAADASERCCRCGIPPALSRVRCAPGGSKGVRDGPRRSPFVSVHALLRLRVVGLGGLGAGRQVRLAAWGLSRVVGRPSGSGQEAPLTGRARGRQGGFMTRHLRTATAAVSPARPAAVAAIAGRSAGSWRRSSCRSGGCLGRRPCGPGRTRPASRPR